MNGDSYTCRADNDVGYDEHTTTINVFGEELHDDGHSHGCCHVTMACVLCDVS